MRRTSALLIVLVSLSLLLPASGTVEKLGDVEQFESSVITSESVWLVVFTAQSEDETKTKGVNKEKCRKVEGEMDAAASELSPLGIKTGLADIEDLAAVASEFNVRKRMLPTAMLFSVRARSAETIPSDLFQDPAKLKAKVEEMLSENPKGKDDKFSKITLSLGGAPEL